MKKKLLSIIGLVTTVAILTTLLLSRGLSVNATSTVSLIIEQGLSQAETTTVIVLAPQTVDTNTPFTIDIQIDPFVPVAGAELDLSFNPELFTVDSVESGGFFSQEGASTFFNQGTIDNINGTITDVWEVIITPGQTVSDLGIFITIYCTSRLRGGESPIALSDVIMGDINGNPVLTTTFDDRLAVIGEVIEKRTISGKTHQVGLGSYATEAIIGAIHWQDSEGNWQELDCTPTRIDNAQLDGWTITESGWHYVLGQPEDKPTDGWVGFGGKQGQHWLKFRLAKVGYLHWPTRVWQDIGGSPTYDRANLTNNIGTTAIGNRDINVSSTAIWSNIWQTPAGGQLSAEWRTTGTGLKEEIIINEAGRTWLKTNRPPTTPLSETWFGFVFQVDWSDIPKIIRQGIELNPDNDFADDGQSIEIRNAANELLGFMPISDVVVRDDEGFLLSSESLRKRFWKEGNNYHLLVGIRCDILNGMADGDLVFDPTVDEQVGASTDDCLRYDTTGIILTYAFFMAGKHYTGYDYNGGARFQTVAIDQGATIDVAYLTLTCAETNSSTVVNTNLEGEDADDAATFSTYGDYDGRARTTALVAWDSIAAWTEDTEYQSPSIVSIIQEITDRVGWSTGNDLVIFWSEDSSVDGTVRRAADSYDRDSAAAPKLHVEWSSCTPDIANTPASKAFGVVSTSTTYWSNGSEPTWPLVDGDALFTITNSSGASVKIQVEATNFTGGVGWTLGAPGENTVRLTVFEEGDGSGDGQVVTTSAVDWITGLADSATIDWELKFETATSHTDGAAKTSTLTLTGVCE